MFTLSQCEKTLSRRGSWWGRASWCLKLHREAEESGSVGTCSCAVFSCGTKMTHFVRVLCGEDGRDLNPCVALTMLCISSFTSVTVFHCWWACSVGCRLTCSCVSISWIYSVLGFLLPLYLLCISFLRAQWFYFSRSFANPIAYELSHKAIDGWTEAEYTG